MKTFKIKSKQSKCYFKVIVYENIKQLRKDTKKYDALRKVKIKDNEDEEILGLCHSFERYKADKDGKFKRLPNIGIIRLAKTYLTTEIVAHEVVHAAMHNYRIDYGNEDIYNGTNGNANFGNNCCDEEENFAYIYGELFRDITNKLYKYGLW